MKVQVKSRMRGFIYGKLRYGYDPDAGRLQSDVFTLRPIEHSTAVDPEGNPIVISVEQQFSNRWMIKVDGGEKVVEEVDEIITPSDMKKDDIIKALTDANVPFANGLTKKELVVLLEDHQATAE